LVSDADRRQALLERVAGEMGVAARSGIAPHIPQPTHTRSLEDGLKLLERSGGMAKGGEVHALERAAGHEDGALVNMGSNGVLTRQGGAAPRPGGSPRSAEPSYAASMRRLLLLAMGCLVSCASSVPPPAPGPAPPPAPGPAPPPAPEPAPASTPPPMSPTVLTTEPQAPPNQTLAPA